MELTSSFQKTCSAALEIIGLGSLIIVCRCAFCLSKDTRFRGSAVNLILTRSLVGWFRIYLFLELIADIVALMIFQGGTYLAKIEKA